MKIIKNCPSDYNIANTQTIQIGTLNYYRKTDNKFIVDPFEGYGHHVFESGEREIIIPEKDATVITKGLIVGARVVIKPGGRVHGGLWSPNVYIFCCSYVQEPSAELAASLGYDSYYEIVDPTLFMQKVQQDFMHSVRLRNKTIREVEVIHVHGTVEYQTERDYSHSEHRSPSDLMIHNLFRKPTISPVHEDVNFATNQEYRFVWILIEPETKQILEVEDDPIRVHNVDDIKQACKY